MKASFWIYMVLVGCTACWGGEYQPVGRITRLSPRMDTLVAQDAQLEILADGFDWCEGPVWVEEGRFLLFSDIPANSVLRWDDRSGIQVYLKPSGYTGPTLRGGESGANGLLLDAAGRLVLCQHGDRRVARMDAPLTAPRPEFVTLADRFEGKRLNSPNDAVFHSSGDLYFTDPPYGLEANVDDPAKELPFQGVFVRRADGNVELLTSDMTRPNGLAFSPDEEILYVANSDPKRPVWMAFPVGADGKLGTGQVLLDASQLAQKEKGLPDGLAVDDQGNLWATGPGGVLVISPRGEHWGTLHTTQATSNCTFGDGGSTLFITADRYLLRIRLTTKGVGDAQASERR